MDGVSFLILPSPALPASAYEGLAAALRRHHVEATVGRADLAAQHTAGDLIQRWAHQVTPNTVLVPHSNAGYLAPSVRKGRASTAILFMDAALPPAESSTTLAPPGFRKFLAGLAGATGLLPPWTQWWSGEDVATVIPEADFPELDRRCPRLPLSYFDYSVAPPVGWTSARNAYLAFGDTYDEEWHRAAASGWPRSRLEGGHLHFLHDPDAVAAPLISLERDLRAEAP